MWIISTVRNVDIIEGRVYSIQLCNTTKMETLRGVLRTLRTPN